jgi:hypothetical protein
VLHGIFSPDRNFPQPNDKLTQFPVPFMKIERIAGRAMAQLDGIPLREYISAYPANMAHTSKTALSSVVQKPRN